MNLLKALLILLCAFQLTTSNASESEDPAEIQQKLEALEAEISKFRQMLESTEGVRSDIENTLESNEKDISEILNKIKDIQRTLKKGEKDLTSLTFEHDNLQGQKQTQQKLISQQIRASYELGNQQYLKVVLNQEDPNKLARMIKYYEYFNQARLEQIRSYEQTLNELAVIEIEITEKNSRLIQERAQLSRQQSGLLDVQAKKQIVLATLIQEISATGNEINKRQKDRQYLEALLERIIAGIVNLPEPDDTQPFTEMKGNLVLPVAGTIGHRFGSGRADGKLRWDGVFIEAEIGEPVHAVHYGRVVFSDWLRGFGLLLIINHGEGYLSLYGHNQVLYQVTGDWVAANQLVANVGNTGGQSEAGLYFEIRSAGEPSDPQLWCQARSFSPNKRKKA